MGSREELTPDWSLYGLTLRTPRLSLRVVSDDDLAELVELARRGIHEPAAMPFAVPWTDTAPDELAPAMLRHYWQQRAGSTPQNWAVEFAVRADGRMVGIQELRGPDFFVTRRVLTGSWLGRGHQGRGLGTEMRCSALMFAFDRLGATRAESAAFTDNPASLRVSEKLGYRPDGTEVVQRRPGERAVDQRLLLTPEWFRPPDWTVRVDGFSPACAAQFGLVGEPPAPGGGPAD